MTVLVDFLKPFSLRTLQNLDSGLRFIAVCVCSWHLVEGFLMCLSQKYSKRVYDYVLLVVVRSLAENGWDISKNVLISEGHNIDHTHVNLSNG